MRDRIGFVLALWVVCELVAFSLVVQAIGLGGALLLGVVTSVIGGSLLKRVGTSALNTLRRQAAANGGVGLQAGLGLDGTLEAIGALLLLLPGFLTDAIGLVLALAVPRAWIARLVQRSPLPTGQTTPRHGPTTIDLAPEDWRPLKD